MSTPEQLPIVVQKYGGSSVADPERMKKVAARVAATAASGKRVVVVVSAMGDTTDGLLELAHQVSDAPPRRELDMLLTAGERISMAVLSMALQARSVDAISFTGSQSGIITNDAHAGARILEVRPYRIQDELERGRVVIVAGFQGVSYKKEITTLGRGGSDTTAVALAAALGAEYCEICTDVDGVYSADPRRVPEARRIESIGQEEMLALAAGGGKVLHRAAVDYARSAGIALWVRATASDPTAKGEGTLVRVGARSEDPRVVAVTSRKVLHLEGEAGVGLAGLIDGVAETGGTMPDLVAHEGGACSLVLSPDDLHGALPAAVEAARAAGRLVVHDDRVALSVVGSAFDRAPALCARVLGLLEAEGVRPELIVASPQRLAFVLTEDSERVAELEGVLHRALLPDES
ncbi:MAG: aspartate kinase [Deltaproteobacteria bacterium]|nr:aspartate kinase [Deltaproteobacteria bacterium]